MTMRQQLQETLDRVCNLLDQLDRRTEKMETILMVREPASTAAADAYEGLRKQVVSTSTERLTHLAQLVQLDAALSHGADADALGRMVREWAEQASVVTVTDPGAPNGDLLFVMVEDLGGPVEVLEPAYMDGVTGRVIRQGQIRRTAGVAPVEPGSGRADGAPPSPGRHGRARPVDEAGQPVEAREVTG
jgi:hypothetical protein